MFDKEKVQKEIDLQVQVTKKFGENAPKAVADYASRQAMKLRAQDQEVEAKKWDEGGVYRIAMHTALGALGTGTIEGALTTGGVASVAPIINQFEDNVMNALIEKGMSSDTAKLVANGVSTLTLTGVGASTGLSTGSVVTAINVDSNNRQLHVDEAKLLKKLTDGKTKAEQDRLRAAACALVECSAGVPTSDPNYQSLKAFEEQGKSYTTEIAALKSTGLFNYSTWDKANDFRTRHDEGLSRVGGAGKIVTGGVTAVGGAAAGAGLCTSGVGCAIGAPLAGTSVVGGVGTAIDGKNQLFGDYNSQEGQKVIDSYNPNRKQELSQLSQDALGGAAAIAEAVLLGKVGGKLSQGVKSEVKTTEKVAEVDAKKQTVENNAHRDDDLWSNKPSGKQEYVPLINKENLLGTPTKTHSKDDLVTINAITRENESARVLANYGKKVEQNPPTLPNGRNPDYLINGEVWDNYAPTSSNVRNIWSEVGKKVKKEQAPNVVVNLNGSKTEVKDVIKQFDKYPIQGLEKVIIIDKAGKPIEMKLGK